jgi:hypothetical protein
MRAHETGYRALLLLAGALYTAAWLAMPSTRSDAARMWRSWLGRNATRDTNVTEHWSFSRQTRPMRHAYALRNCATV